MANIKSAIKRIQVAERNRLRNKSYKSALKTLSKRFLSSLDTYEANPSPETMQAAQKSLSAAFSKIDKSVKCGALHPNAGARRKARLARALKKREATAV